MVKKMRQVRSFGLAISLLAGISLAQLVRTSSVDAQSVAASVSPTAILDLKTHADGKTDAQLAFDPQGRLLVLYRDRNPAGQQNWHLLRITSALGESLKKEEVSFDLFGVPKPGPYSSVHLKLLVTDDGKVAYAVFNVDMSTGGRMPFREFGSAVAVNLRDMRVLSKGDLGWRSYYSQVDGRGDLLYAVNTGRDVYKISTYGSDLIERASVVQKDVDGLQCVLLRNASFLCGQDGQLKSFALNYTHLPSGVGLGWYVRHSPIADSDGLLGIASIAPLKTPQSLGIHSEDRAWKMTTDGQVTMAPDTLTPGCRDAWLIPAVSGDGREFLAGCFEAKDFLDAFFHYVLQGIQLIDSTDLTVRRRLKGVRGDPVFSIWHGNSHTVIAVLENAQQLKLKLYAIPDGN